MQTSSETRLGGTLDWQRMLHSSTGHGAFSQLTLKVLHLGRPRVRRSGLTLCPQDLHILTFTSTSTTFQPSAAQTLSVQIEVPSHNSCSCMQPLPQHLPRRPEHPPGSVMLVILVLRPGRGPASLRTLPPSSDCHALAASADLYTSCSRGGQATLSSTTGATAAAVRHPLHAALSVRCG